ncbi:MAG: flagellar assembly protein FliW [Deltaproteobacteria bacterium]|nr:flagellar assembly protein FliW [Deltaproteobacteria bacterium]
MKKIDSRFGQVEYNSANLLHFPEGVIGFPSLHDFIIMPNRKKGPLFWIQAVDDGEIAFVLTDPTHFFPDYNIVPDENERKLLHMESEDPCFTLAVVTVPPDQKISLNLAAPILFSPSSNLAVQIILENGDYNSKTFLPAV